jgi:hypothetical protein
MRALKLFIVLAVLSLNAQATGLSSDSSHRVVPDDLLLLSTFTVGISSSADGTIAKISVSGSVTLGGPLVVNATGAPFPAGKTYLLIDNDGSDPVVGTFAGLPEGSIITSGGQRFSLSYVGNSGNDVVLSAIATPVPSLDAVGLTVLAATLAVAALFAIKR